MDGTVGLVDADAAVLQSNAMRNVRMDSSLDGNNDTDAWEQPQHVVWDESSSG